MRPFNVCALVAAATALACHGDHISSPANQGPYPFTDIAAPAGGVAQFSVLPVAIAPGLTLTALGSLNPPGHVLPTDHVYFYDWDLSGSHPFGNSDIRTVYAPATGVVIFVLPNTAGETKVIFRCTDNFYYYLDHVVLSPALALGQVVQAGAQIGSTLPGQTVDLGAFDMSVTHPGFVAPGRYSIGTLHYVSPWRYFTPALQGQIYPSIYRAPTATDKDGKIDFSVAGKLVGDWYLQSMPADSSYDPYGWTRTISFVYDYYDPTQVRISIGGTVATPGVWQIDSTAPAPATVSVASGTVSYRLYSPFDNHPQFGLMLVQMTSDTAITVEIFPGSSVTSAKFDAGAMVFVR